MSINCSVWTWPGSWCKYPKHVPQTRVVVIVVVIGLPSRVWLFVTPWTAACQASLSITNSRSLLKLRSIESGMPSNISSSVVPFSPCLQSFPASGTFVPLYLLAFPSVNNPFIQHLIHLLEWVTYLLPGPWLECLMLTSTRSWLISSQCTLHRTRSSALGLNHFFSIECDAQVFFWAHSKAVSLSLETTVSNIWTFKIYTYWFV